MKRLSLLLFILLLTACLPPSGTPPIIESPPASEVTSAPTAENTPVPTITPTPTEIPVEALPVDEIVQKYLAGEMDSISNLSLEKQNAFRLILTEQLKESTKLRLIFTEPGTGQRVYLDWETGTMRKVEEGGEQTIATIREISVNADGSINLHENGQANPIAGSQYVTNWNEIITDPNSTSVDWPKTKPGNSGFPGAQWFLTLNEETVYKRVVFGEKKVLKIPVKGPDGRIILLDTLPTYKIVTDQDGNPLYARLVFCSAAGKIDYFVEGNTFEDVSRASDIERTILKNMDGYSVYFIGFETKQKAIVDAEDVNFGYKNKVPQTNSGEVLLGRKTDDKNLLHVLVRMLIKGKN